MSLLEYGMVNEILPHDQFIARAYKLADHIMSQPRTTRRLATQIVRRPWKHRIVNDLDGGFGIQMFGHLAKQKVVHGRTHISDTVYGLVAYLYTRDLQRGLRVSEQLDVGKVGLNRGLVSDPAVPFGGTKHSGLGREGSHEGIKEFLETQYVSAAW